MLIHALVAVAAWTLFLNHASAGAHLMAHGLDWLVSSRDADRRPEPSALEARVERAHRNHLENVVVFFALAVAVVATGGGESWWPVVSGWAFLGARVAHVTVYAAGIAPLRSLTHVVTLSVHATLILALLGLV